MPRKLSATPSRTSPLPPNADGSTACSANASVSASIPRNTSRPAVNAMKAASQAGLA